MERLRRGVFDAETGNYNDIGLCDEAAARIEQLEEALREIGNPPDHFTINDAVAVARAALER